MISKITHNPKIASILLLAVLSILTAQTQANLSESDIPTDPYATLDANEEQYIEEMRKKARADLAKSDELPENPIPENMTEDATQVSELKKWIYNQNPNNNVLDSLYPYYLYNGEYRGISSKENIKKNTVVLSMQANSYISLNNDARPLPMNQKIDDHKLRLMGPTHTLIANYMLTEWEKGSESKWSTFFKILPKKFDSMATAFTPDEKKWLKGSSMVAMIDQKLKELRDDYNKVADLIEGYRERFTFDDFHYFRSMIITRTFGISYYDPKRKYDKDTIVVPYSDLINHEHPHDIHWGWNHKSNAFEFVTVKDIPKNKEIFASYGHKCNTRFLLNYGFVEQNNIAHNYANFNWVPLDFENQPLYNEKRDFQAQQHKLLWDPFYKVGLSFDEQTMKRTLGYLRQWSIDNDSDWKTYFVYFNRYYEEMGMVSLYAEIKMLELLEKFCSEKLEGYPTTAEEDREILAKNDMNLTFNESNMVIFRLGEKEVLNLMVEFASNMSRALKGSTREEIVANLDELTSSKYHASYKDYIESLDLKKKLFY